MKATEVTAGPAESNGSLLPGLWRDSLRVTWLPVHRNQLRAQRSVTSMGKLNLYLVTICLYLHVLQDTATFFFEKLQFFHIFPTLQTRGSIWLQDRNTHYQHSAKYDHNVGQMWKKCWHVKSRDAHKVILVYTEITVWTLTKLNDSVNKYSDNDEFMCWLTKIQLKQSTAHKKVFWELMKNNW